MDTLRLVEVAPDGELVLMTGDGRRFRFEVDEQVRTAVRRTRPAPTPGPDDRTPRPGPREVQARIRAGADAEEVASQTGLDVDYVRRFEGPVLAERAHVSEVARAALVDRGDPGSSLERVVLDELGADGGSVDDVRWDSRKVEGTRWHVVARSRSAGTVQEATWVFDTATRSLEAADAAAERLTGAERRRRLSAVRETVFDVERPAPGTGRPRGGTVELLDTLARQRGRRPVLATDALGVGRDAAEERPAPVVEQAEQAEGTDEEAAPGDGPAPATTTRRPLGLVRAGGTAEPVEGSGDVPASPSIEPDLLSELHLDVPLPAPLPRPSSAPADRRRPAASSFEAARTGTEPDPAKRPRRRRAAVPSWDEIVFGAKRDG
ncbi:septation protein SepH [Aquipuribacter nitratireducens]|uniref:Septation protein SepH n=1 Tax=Aquipuribacter nitratireducens TaxID=650104 RepID=A0ABW0GIJ3_9MICO